jgi:hypothetical protein
LYADLVIIPATDRTGRLLGQYFVVGAIVFTIMDKLDLGKLRL